MDKIDGAFFTFSALASIWFGYLLVRDGVEGGWQLSLLVVFWLFASYLLLPRLHRILTRVYVPGYFIGRTRTSDGLLGDPINLGFRGTEQQLHHLMRAAGWTRADDIDIRSTRRIISSTLTRRSYAEAPVSPLHLFDRQQDFAYQQEMKGNPAQRHHVRFWRCPEGWMLPGGYEVEWLAAGTYDRRVGLSLFTLQVTHKIEANIDIERDFIVDSLTAADAAVQVRVIENFSTGYHSRNGGGDLIETDGDLPIVDTRAVAAPEADRDAAVEPTDSRDRRPAQTLFGAGVAIARSLLYLAFAVFLFSKPHEFAKHAREAGIDITAPQAETFATTTALVLCAAALIDVVLGLGVLAGRNLPRLTLMSICVITTTGAFISNARGTDVVTTARLPTVGLSILVLLALSSHRARDYAVRHR